MLSTTWDNSLLRLANVQAERADERRADERRADERREFLLHEEHRRHAYEYCERLTAQNSRSFHLASALLPGEKRQAVRALYAFCRTTDDIVDHPAGNVQQRLARWEQIARGDHPPEDDPVAVAWVDAREHYGVPRAYAGQLIDGIRRDLTQTRYEHFEDLITYCYGVASTVGLMSMHIIGFREEAAVRYAIKLGVALQLTNILRDVAEDFARGRCYLPQDELAAFGLSEADLAEGVADERWRAFMRFQIARARHIYEEAWPGIAMLEREGQIAIAAAAVFYRAILDDIEAHDYDVFSRRAHVGAWGKLRRMPGLWWHYRVRAQQVNEREKPA